MTGDTKGVFISYRREEAAAHAGWLAQRLGEHFGEHKVFRDIDPIEPGLDFVEAIQRAVDSAEVVLVVIGKSWLTATDAAARQRLRNPLDRVRGEIAAALQSNVRVLPVLIQGASMPSADELPDDLAALAHRIAFELHDTSWRDDIRRLTNALENVVVSQVEDGSGGCDARRPMTRSDAAASYRARSSPPVRHQSVSAHKGGGQDARRVVDSPPRPAVRSTEGRGKDWLGLGIACAIVVAPGALFLALFVGHVWLYIF
jgi:hypothetical protein